MSGYSNIKTPPAEAATTSSLFCPSTVAIMRSAEAPSSACTYAIKQFKNRNAQTLATVFKQLCVRDRKPIKLKSGCGCVSILLVTLFFLVAGICLTVFVACRNCALGISIVETTDLFDEKFLGVLAAITGPAECYCDTQNSIVPFAFQRGYRGIANKHIPKIGRAGCACHVLVILVEVGDNWVFCLLNRRARFMITGGTGIDDVSTQLNLHGPPSPTIFLNLKLIMNSWP